MPARTKAQRKAALAFRPVSRPKRRKIEQIATHLDKPLLQRGLVAISETQLNDLVAAAASGAKPPRFTRIEQHTDAQLEMAIVQAARDIPDFWKIMHGIDAYMEKRRRKHSGRVGHAIPFTTRWQD
jgi:hypothetical protein